MHSNDEKGTFLLEIKRVTLLRAKLHLSERTKLCQLQCAQRDRIANAVTIPTDESLTDFGTFIGGFKVGFSFSYHA